MSARTKKKGAGEAPAESITSYKGFDAGLKCRNYQYEIGGEYEHKGEVEACASGFHACEYPLDVFGYYEPGASRYAVVEQSGVLARDGDDSKVASSRLTIKAEIGIAGIIKAAIDYTFSRVKPVDPSSPASNSGDYGAASNSGYGGAASNSGKAGVACGLGIANKALSSKFGAIVLVCRDDEGNIVAIRASKVGENGIKPDTWYSLSADGEFVEVRP